MPFRQIHYLLTMINKTCPLILRDLYSYDIVSAFPTIMGRQFYDFKDISLKDKKERNIFIGKQQINNPELTSFLTQSVNSLVDFYLRSNELTEDDIIFRQKDGFISKKKLVKNDQFIEMKYRGLLNLMIINNKRTSMIYFDDFGDMSVKGVPYYYPNLNRIYKKFLDLDFYNTKILMEQLNFIRNKVLYSDDISLYAVSCEDGFYRFMMKNGKSMKVRDMDYVDLNDIDTRKYFNFFFKIFIDPIYLEVMTK